MSSVTKIRLETMNGSMNAFVNDVPFLTNDYGNNDLLRFQFIHLVERSCPQGIELNNAGYAVRLLDLGRELFPHLRNWEAKACVNDAHSAICRHMRIAVPDFENLLHFEKSRLSLAPNISVFSDSLHYQQRFEDGELVIYKDDAHYWSELEKMYGNGYLSLPMFEGHTAVEKRQIELEQIQSAVQVRVMRLGRVPVASIRTRTFDHEFARMPEIYA